MSERSPSALPIWQGARYAANTAHHRATDAAFLDTFTLAEDAQILDIGCGAGDFTRKLADLVPSGRVVGIDPSASLLDVARSVSAPNQTFEQRRAQDLDLLEPAQEFDAVISRATMHWVRGPDHPEVLAAAQRHLRPGGLLRWEFGGAGNVESARLWLNELSIAHGGQVDPWYFPGAGEYFDLIDAAGFELSDGWVRLIAQRRPFDRAGLIGWFTSQAALAYQHGMAPEAATAFEAEIVANIDQMQRLDGSYDLTFVRMDVKAFRR